MSTSNRTIEPVTDTFTGPIELTRREKVLRAINGDTVRLLGVLILLVVAFSALRPDAFPTLANFFSILSDAAILLVLAVGATYVIITAGIDLSVGAVLVFASVISAKVMAAMGGDGFGALAVGFVVAILSGSVWGLINGFLVARAAIPPLIVTLATMGAALGASYLITNGVDVRQVPFTLVETIGSGTLLGIPVLALIAFAVAAIFGIILAKTKFGLHTYAAGSNIDSLSRTGVNTRAHIIKVYVLASALAGLAGYMSIARFASTTIGGHATDNLQVITAVVIGGASLFGGRGLMIGTVIGVFIPAVLQNGLVVVGVSSYWQPIAIGAVLLGAVYLDQMRRKANSRG